MSNLEQALKAAAKRLDAAIKRELELHEQRKPQGNPEDDKFKADYEAAQKAKRFEACVNACADFSDPKIDIGLLKLDNEQKAKLLASCETALAERDTEIAQLKARVKELETQRNMFMYALSSNVDDNEDDGELDKAEIYRHIHNEARKHFNPSKPQQ